MSYEANRKEFEEYNEDGNNYSSELKNESEEDRNYRIYQEEMYMEKRFEKETNSIFRFKKQVLDYMYSNCLDMGKNLRIKDINEFLRTLKSK